MKCSSYEVIWKNLTMDLGYRCLIFQGEEGVKGERGEPVCFDNHKLFVFTTIINCIFCIIEFLIGVF